MSDVCTLDKTNFKRTEIFNPATESTGDISRYYPDNPDKRENFMGNQLFPNTFCRESYKNLLRTTQSTWRSIAGELDMDLLSASYNLKVTNPNIDTELYAFLINNDFHFKIAPKKEYKIKIKIKDIKKAKPNYFDMEYFE